MNYFRWLWTFFFACQAVFAFGITLTFAADNTVNADDASLAAPKNLSTNRLQGHNDARPPLPTEELVGNLWAGSPKIRYGNLILYSSISEQALDEQVAHAYQRLLSNTTHEPLLLPAQNKQVKRVRAIAHKLAPYALKWNEQVKNWQWEVNVIHSLEMRTYGFPGGKIIIYSGMLNRLRLNDHEIALLLAHQIAHALREHVRAHLSEAPLILNTALTPSLLFGLAHPSIALPSNPTQLLSVQYSHTDETEADVIGADIAARAGYDPRAALTLWRRLNNMSRQTQVDFVVTHPFAKQRIRDFRKRLPELLPIYNKARRKAAKSAALASPHSARP